MCFLKVFLKMRILCGTFLMLPTTFAKATAVKMWKCCQYQCCQLPRNENLMRNILIVANWGTGNGERVSQPMRPYAVYVPLCVKAAISNLILYLKRKVAHSSQSSTKTPADTKP